jgi:hypothetical protein
VLRIIGVVTAPFTMGKDRHYVSPTALRISIEELVYATMLYEIVSTMTSYSKWSSGGAGRSSIFDP